MQAFILAVLLLATSLAEPFTTRTVVVRGTVLADSASGAPVAGANVWVSTAGASATTVTTGVDGGYLLTASLPDRASTLTVRARALGYAPAATSVVITSDTVVVNLVLKRSGALLESVVVTGAADKSSTRVLSRGVVTAGQGAIALRGAAPARDRWNTEEYARIEDNRFLAVASAPLSTFSVDVDRASYTNVRRHITQGTLPPKDAVRIEELVNAFRYGYAEPRGAEPVTVTTDVAAAPWNAKHRIVRIGLQTKRIRTDKLPPSNLVFLLDVSGSMDQPDKLPLVKQAFRLLVDELREQDRVAIVVYAGAAGLVLPSTSAADKPVILDAIERLEAGGSTAGGAGIRLAYDVAKQGFMAEGNNRVILATDGDFNVGVSNTADLVRFVEERRADGISLTVLGFGMGNIKDSRLEQLADKGNGNYAYVDDLLEAKQVLVTEMGATLLTVAKDVKLQVEFNPSAVQAYRLIGYENRLLRNEDFADDAKDAGDMGAGHSVTALYEIVPAGIEPDVKIGTTAPLRYRAQAPSSPKRGARSDELLFVNIRYKLPSEATSRLLQHAVRDTRGPAGTDLRFALAVAGYGMLLRDSEFKGMLTYEDVLAQARGAAGEERQRLDFVDLVSRTARIAAGVAAR